MLRPKTMPYAAGLAALLALAGCAGAEGGGTTPSASLVAEATPTTSAATTSVAAAPSAEPNFPPGLPAAAKKHTKAGAEAFVGHFIAQVNEAWQDPDPQRLRVLCLKESKACSAYINSAQRFADNGQYYSSDPIKVSEITVLTLQGAQARVFATINVLGAKIVNEKGQILKADNVAINKNMFYVAWGPSGWSIAEVRNTR